MFVEDLHAFVDDFGVTCAFTRGATPVASFKAIFDAPPTETAVYDRSFYDEKFYSARVLGQELVLTAVATDAISLEPHDAIVLNSITYYVSYTEPDGTGMMLIHLSLNKV